MFLHYPGQFIRNKDKPIYEKALGEIDQRNIDVTLSLSYISLLKKRPDANEKCNADLKNDDHEFKVQVVKSVGCIPIYWKSFLIHKNIPYYICNNSLQLGEVHRLISNHHQVTNKYLPPCIEMQTPVNVQERLWNPLDGQSIK